MVKLVALPLGLKGFRDYIRQEIMCLLCLLKFFGKDNKYKHPDRCRSCPAALMQVCVCRQCVCVWVSFDASHSA